MLPADGWLFPGQVPRFRGHLPLPHPWPRVPHLDAFAGHQALTPPVWLHPPLARSPARNLLRSLLTSSRPCSHLPAERALRGTCPSAGGCRLPSAGQALAAEPGRPSAGGPRGRLPGLHGGPVHPAAARPTGGCEGALCLHRGRRACGTRRPAPGGLRARRAARALPEDGAERPRGMR